MSDKSTVPKMAALVRVANSTPTIHGYATDAHFEAAVTAAVRLAKALAEILRCEDPGYDNKAAALLDELYPNWREVL